MTRTTTDFRIAVDIGGTFTDVVIERRGEPLHVFKSPSTPDDPLVGIMAALDGAGHSLGMSREDLLRQASAFIHATTRGLNAVLTRTTARTALLTTAGHPDILTFREGGRVGIFNHAMPYPPPYVPRALTYEVSERVGATGAVLESLDEAGVLRIVADLKAQRVEAVAVCLLWSIVNSSHERRVGQILASELPGVPTTLSHQLNPILREYRRASSTCIDASLKPVMSDYLARLETDLKRDGFGGAMLIVSSTGGLIGPARARQAPIHTLRSGPAMAPIAARYLLDASDIPNSAAIVLDTGGTSFDISIVRDGVVPRTSETWLGDPFVSDMTGFPSIDVRSVGAGGGSIASVDQQGLLRVGPESAGADPGPACYGNGGTLPTMTDACLVLGYLDPARFLDGDMVLDAAAAYRTLETEVATPLRVGVEEAAEMVVRLATEIMARTVEHVTLDQGLDPRTATIVAGGGAAGLNTVELARSLGCAQVLVPRVAAALSAVGAISSPIISEYVVTLFASTADFPLGEVNRVLHGLREQCEEFLAAAGLAVSAASVTLSADARYAHQVWEISVPLSHERFDTSRDVEEFRLKFDAIHGDLRGMHDPESPVEIVSWRATVTSPARGDDAAGAAPSRRGESGPGDSRGMPNTRSMRFPDVGVVSGSVWAGADLAFGDRVDGPGVIELPKSTVVLPPGSTAVWTKPGILIDAGQKSRPADSKREEVTS